jgi:2,3-bisphosphoglycerate-dependent phosphoglycerate mutase
MELVIIRHGLPITRVTDDGTAADPPLSEVGRKQAQRMADWLADEAFDAIYVSPLRRARETVAPLATSKGMGAEVHPGVAEFDQHSDTYIPLEELKVINYELWRRQMEEKRFGEADPHEFREVVVAALSEIAGSHRGGRVAVVCHGGVINAWASHVLGIHEVFFFDPTYTSINRFMVASTGQRSVVSLNEAAHLRGL